MDENGYLISVTDRTGVERISGNPMYPNEVHKWVALDDNSLVSMNMWASGRIYLMKCKLHLISLLMKRNGFESSLFYTCFYE